MDGLMRMISKVLWHANFKNRKKIFFSRTVFEIVTGKVILADCVSLIQYLWNRFTDLIESLTT